MAHLTGWALKLITAPTAEPLTLAEAKSYLRLDTTDEDTLVATLITAARMHLDGADGILGRQLMPATWELVLQEFPWGHFMGIPLPPLQSVTSIKYKDKDSVEATMPAADYLVSTDQEPGRITLAYGKSWPSTTLRPIDAVRVRFVAGYADAASVPQPLKNAMLLHIAHLYEHREPVVVGKISTVIPFTHGALIFPFRLHL